MPVNLGMIAIVSLLFFAAAAVGLSLVSSALALGRDAAFFVDVFLSVAFFQLFAHRVVRWRSVSHAAAGRTATDAGA